MNQADALRAAAEGLDLGQKGRLPEAEARYRQALSLADPRHHETPDIHSQYAGVLTRLHRLAEAERHYERALALELQNQAADESHPGVILARYLLGEHYLRGGEPDSARRVVGPSLASADKPLAWLVEAEALWLSGSVTDARSAAERALSLASTTEQRERMRARLSALLEAPQIG